jgi:hypothetical protein
MILFKPYTVGKLIEVKAHGGLTFRLTFSVNNASMQQFLHFLVYKNVKHVHRKKLINFEEFT